MEQAGIFSGVADERSIVTNTFEIPNYEYDFF
jgi:hypothetical protein